MRIFNIVGILINFRVKECCLEIITLSNKQKPLKMNVIIAEKKACYNAQIQHLRVWSIIKKNPYGGGGSIV